MLVVFFALLAPIVPKRGLGHDDVKTRISVDRRGVVRVYVKYQGVETKPGYVSHWDFEGGTLPKHK